MTRKMLVGAAVLAGLCMGQGCPGVAPAEKKGIPQGVYSGTVNCLASWTVMGPNGTQTESVPVDPYTVNPEFGSNGIELTAQSSDLQPGDYKDMSLGPARFQATVSSVTAATDKLIVFWDMTLTFNDGTQTINLTGFENLTYSVSADGSINLTSHIDVASEVIDGEMGRLIRDCTGTLLP